MFEKLLRYLLRREKMVTTTSSCQATGKLDDIEDMENNPNFSHYKKDGVDIWYYDPKE